MMDFEQYVESVKKNIFSELPNQYRDAIPVITHSSKINDSYTALSMMQEGEKFGIAINLDQLYQEYASGRISYDESISFIADRLQQEKPEIEIQQFQDYEQVKDKLFIRVSGAEQNKEMLENVPHQEEAGLAVTYHFMVIDDGEQFGSAMVSNDLMNKYGISLEQLHHDALENSGKLFPPVFMTMGEMMLITYQDELMKQGFSQEAAAQMAESVIPAGASPMYVVTNEQRINGAAALFYPGMMDEIGEKLGQDYIVLPSSIHEMIIVPDDGMMNAIGASEMVTDVNDAQVAPEERLADQAFHYDCRDHMFEKFYDFEGRMADKEREAKREDEKSDVKKEPKRESVLKKLEQKQAKVKPQEKGSAQHKAKDVDIS